MTDPWTGKRDLLRHAAMSDNSWPRMLGEELEELLSDADALLKVVPIAPPVHEADQYSVPCPYEGPGPWDHNECDCGYWGRLEAWAKEIEETLITLPEHLRSSK